MIWGYFQNTCACCFWGHWGQRRIEVEFWCCDLENSLKSFQMFQILMGGKVQRADLTCDVIKKLAPFVLSKLWILVADWSMRWSRDTFLIKLRLYICPKQMSNNWESKVFSASDFIYQRKKLIILKLANNDFSTNIYAYLFLYLVRQWKLE